MPKFCSWMFAALLTALLVACGGGGGGSNVPLATAEEVRAAFNAAPQLLGSYFYQSSAQRRDVQMEYLQADDLKDPWHLVVRYKGVTIYDKTLWAIYNLHGITSDGTDVILLSEYSSAGSWNGESVVFVNGEKVPELQSLLVDFSKYGHYPAAVREIREYRDGWFIIFAALQARGGYYVNRWAMYRSSTKEFIDCGELDSNRHEDWGPSVSSACVRH